MTTGARSIQHQIGGYVDGTDQRPQDFSIRRG
jgi:hypothetical protein